MPTLPLLTTLAISVNGKSILPLLRPNTLEGIKEDILNSSLLCLHPNYQQILPVLPSKQI